MNTQVESSTPSDEPEPSLTTTDNEPPQPPQQPPSRPLGRGEWVLVTPARAAEFLVCSARQRKLVLSHVEHLARQMREGLWDHENPEPIIFNTRDEMIEGQHRCRAVVKSGTSIWMYVQRGVPDSVFRVCNTGRTRTAADIIGIRYKEGSSSALASAAGLLWRYRNGKMLMFVRFAPEEIESVVDANKRLALCADNSRELTSLLSGGPATFCRFIFSELNLQDAAGVRMTPPDLTADAFLEQVETGSSERGTGSRELRERLLANRASRRKLSPIEKIAITIKAWNADRDGRPVKQLKWGRRRSPGKPGEPFPVAE